MKKTLWYEKNFRRHLCDMHIDDWNEEFLSKFSAKTYYDNLKRANLSAAMLYYQSHVGLCYYPTKTAKIHDAFIGREDEMRKLTDMCRAGGISVVGYYSLNYNVWAHDNHPEWRMITESGHSMRDTEDASGEINFESAGGRRYGICCPNNEDYLAFVYSQIDEMLAYFKPDALFFDMLYWPHACYCDSCRRRWKKDTGNDHLPTHQSFDDPEWRLFCHRRNEWMGEYAQKVTDYVKKKAPDITVEHNVSAAAKGAYLGTGMSVNRASEFCGGDLAGGLLEESVACKLFREISMNQPFEYMFPKCEPSLYRHTLTKTDEHIEAAVFLAAAHHGATMVIDAIDPIGTMDERSFDAIGRAFGKLIPYEKYLKGQPITDIGVAYGLDSKGEGRFGNKSSNHTATVSFIKNMIEGGIPVGVISKKRDLSEYKMIFASNLFETEDELCSALDEYAENGGILYLSGASNPEFIKKLTGLTISGMTSSDTCYFAPEKEYERTFEGFCHDYPLHVNGRVALVEGAGESHEVMARLVLPYTDPKEKKFASIHSNPPGIHTGMPAVIRTKYGRGVVIYSAAPIEDEDYVTYQRIIRNIIDEQIGLDNITVRADAPTNVETTAYRDENSIYVCNALLLDPKDKPFMPGFDIRVKSDIPAEKVVLLPGGEQIPFTYSDGAVQFRTKSAKIFDMYEIIFSKR